MIAAATVKPNSAQNLMLGEPMFRTRIAASIAEIESLRTTLLIETWQRRKRR